MDFDKLTVFVKTLGFPIAIAAWFLWKIQAFMESISANGIITNELLRQLVELHK